MGSEESRGTWQEEEGGTGAADSGVYHRLGSARCKQWHAAYALRAERRGLVHRLCALEWGHLLSLAAHLHARKKRQQVQQSECRPCTRAGWGQAGGNNAHQRPAVATYTFQSALGHVAGA